MTTLTMTTLHLILTDYFYNDYLHLILTDYFYNDYLHLILTENFTMITYISY